MNKRKVIWPFASRQQMRRLYTFIKKDSLLNAENVRKSIADSAKALSEHPSKHAPDKFKADNDGSFRAYEIHHYRIAYRITDTEIIIVRVRHTSMEPLVY